MLSKLSIMLLCVFTAHSLHTQSLKNVATALNTMADEAAQTVQTAEARELAQLFGELVHVHVVNEPKEGYTLLHAAVKLARFVNPPTLTALQKHINTLLDLDKINTLVIRENKDVISPLMMVADQVSASQSPLVRATLSPQYIDFMNQLLTAFITHVTKNSETPLFYAAEKDLPDVVYALLTTKQADITHKNEEGDTPLHTAVKHGSKDVVRVIVNRAPHAIAIKNDDGKTALDITREIKKNKGFQGASYPWVVSDRIIAMLSGPNIQQELEGLAQALNKLAQSLK